MAPADWLREGWVFSRAGLEPVGSSPVWPGTSAAARALRVVAAATQARPAGAHVWRVPYRPLALSPSGPWGPVSEFLSSLSLLSDIVFKPCVAIPDAPP